MIQRNPYLALALTTLVGVAIVIAVYLSLNDPGPPPESEQERFDRVHTVFIEAFAGGAAWSGRIEPLGLQSSRTAAHSPGWRISGSGGACDASGSYVIRDQPAAALAVTAPHSQSDVNTGELAQKLFDDLNLRAAAWNTAPRAASEECGPGLDLTTDRVHPFSAFALAFAESHSDGLVIQLHGIEESNQSAVDVTNLAIVLRRDDATSSEVLTGLANCLEPIAEPLTVAVVSDRQGDAGNAQSRVLRQNGFGDFVQVDISRELRATLLVDSEKRAGFGACLVAATRN